MKTTSAYILVAALLVASAVSTGAHALGAAKDNDSFSSNDGRIESIFITESYGSDPETGSDPIMAENSIPEPSAALKLISGVGILLLIRRRKQ
jgi:hypothetical protein